MNQNHVYSCSELKPNSVIENCSLQESVFNIRQLITKLFTTYHCLNKNRSLLKIFLDSYEFVLNAK